MGPQQLEASCALGLLYESQGQPGLAMACHERCLQLSQELQRPDDAATAYAQLVQVGAGARHHVQHQCTSWQSACTASCIPCQAVVFLILYCFACCAGVCAASRAAEPHRRRGRCSCQL